MAVKIFFCYAHEDEALLNKLKTHLRPLQRQGLIDVWYDREISAGTEWEQEISLHLNEATIILLLVSPDFMNSDYCYSNEMQRAIERHQRGEARVIPIILHPVYWQGILGNIQALPKDAKPVSSWRNRNEAFFNVVDGIRKISEEILPFQVAEPESEPSSEQPASAVGNFPPSSSSGAISDEDNTISSQSVQPETRLNRVNQPNTEQNISGRIGLPPPSPLSASNLSNNSVSRDQQVNEEGEREQESTFTIQETGEGRDHGQREPEAPVSVPDTFGKPLPSLSPNTSSDLRPSSPFSRKSKLAVVALVAVLIVAAGSVLFSLLATKLPKSFSKTPTTHTPVLTITLTSSQGTKLVTATPNILLTAEASNPIYSDVLTSSSPHKAIWQGVGTNNSPCVFASDGYHVRINPSTNPEAICHEVANSYQDFAVRVDIVLDRGSGGLIFRDQDVLRGNGAYLFEITMGGEYKISTVTQDRVLKNWTVSSAIHRGNKVRNTLQVVASQHLLFFYINGIYLTEIIDGTFSDGGISFACFGSGEAIFSNLYVYPYQ